MALHLRAARINAGFTQEEVAETLGKSKNTIVGYETYKRVPDVKTAQRMAALYGMSIDDIIFFVE